MQFGKAILEKDDRGEKVWMVGDQMIGDRYIAKQGLIEIIQCRIEELLEIIKGQLGDLCNKTEIPAGVIYTGGLSVLPGARCCLPEGIGTQWPSGTKSDLGSGGFEDSGVQYHYRIIALCTDGARIKKML